MKWLNYHHLIYFRQIARSGSISKAAIELKVGQPALSTQLKSLEDSLGKKLFERRSKRLFLTEAGNHALDYAEKINSLGQELIDVLEKDNFGNKVSLRVGCLDSIPKHLICDIVDLAYKKTGCFLSIYEESIDRLLDKLSSHQLDLIISDRKILSHYATKTRSKLILNRPVAAYAAPEFKNLKKDFPNNMDNIPTILPTNHSKLRLDIEQYFSEHRITPKIIGETQDTSLQKILATKGDGVVFLPMFSAQELVRDKKLVKIGELDNVFAEYYLIHSERVTQNPAMSLVIEQYFESMKLGF